MRKVNCCVDLFFIFLPHPPHPFYASLIKLCGCCFFLRNVSVTLSYWASRSCTGDSSPLLPHSDIYNRLSSPSQLHPGTRLCTLRQYHGCHCVNEILRGSCTFTHKVFNIYPYTCLLFTYHCFHLFYIYFYLFGVKLCLWRSNLFISSIYMVYIVLTVNSNVVVYRIVGNLMALVAS